MFPIDEEKKLSKDTIDIFQCLIINKYSLFKLSVTIVELSVRSVELSVSSV